MTTTPQPEGGGDPVPRYFMDFVAENARQHAELSDKIAAVNAELSDKIAAVNAELSDKIAAVNAELSGKIAAVNAELSDKIAGTNASVAEVKGELRIIKALAFALTGAALVALSKYVIGW